MMNNVPIIKNESSFKFKKKTPTAIKKIYANKLGVFKKPTPYRNEKKYH